MTDLLSAAEIAANLADIRTLVQEQLHHLGVVPGAGQVERCVTIL